MSSEDADYTLEMKDPEIVSLDSKSGNATAIKEGEETSVSLRQRKLI